jgi:hypothetical protein
VHVTVIGAGTYLLAVSSWNHKRFRELPRRIQDTREVYFSRSRVPAVFLCRVRVVNCCYFFSFSDTKLRRQNPTMTTPLDSDLEAGGLGDGAPGDTNNNTKLTEQASLLSSGRSFDTPLWISSYAIRPEGVLEEVPLKEAMGTLAKSGGRDGGDPLWIDVEIQGNIAKELPLLTETILDKLDLTPFLRRHLAEPMQLQTPQVLPLSQSALIVMRILGTSDRDTRNAAALCLPSILLTVTSTSSEQKAVELGGKKAANKPG